MICRLCEKDKKSSHFRCGPKRGKVCTECYNKRNKIRWRKDPIRKAKHFLARALKSEETKKIVEGMLSEGGCSFCGIKDHTVLKYEHRMEEIRSFRGKTVYEMVKDSYSLPTVLKEIEKCFITCANCDQRKKYDQQKLRRSQQITQFNESLSRKLQESSVRLQCGTTEVANSGVDPKPSPVQL